MDNCQTTLNQQSAKSVQIPLITSGVMSRLVCSDSVAHAQARTLLGRDKPVAVVRAFTRAFRASDLR
jgi:hypothetical protein